MIIVYESIKLKGYSGWGNTSSQVALKAAAGQPASIVHRQKAALGIFIYKGKHPSSFLYFPNLGRGGGT